MPTFVEVLNPALWGVAAFGALIALLIRPGASRDRRLASGTLLALAALGLLAALAVAAWLPPRALLVHPDGSTGDPRLVSMLVLGFASLAALVPALRSLRLPALGLLGLLLPGLALAGLVGAVGSFLGLGAPTALASLALAGLVFGTGLTAFARLRWNGLGILALQASATGLLLAAGVLSLHGARAPMLELHEGAATDTLGIHISLHEVQAPSDSLRRMEFVLSGPRASSSVWTSIAGRPGAESRSTAGGGLFGGPLVVPLELRESRPESHDVVWLAKGDSASVGASTIRFAGFRIVPGDTVRMLADLDVTTAGRTQRVSPGMYARREGTTPFAAVAEGLGPIAVGRMDADQHRVALVLPAPGATAPGRVAVTGLHLRPALPWAWLGAGLTLLAFALGFAVRSEGPPRRE